MGVWCEAAEVCSTSCFSYLHTLAYAFLPPNVLLLERTCLAPACPGGVGLLCAHSVTILGPYCYLGGPEPGCCPSPDSDHCKWESCWRPSLEEVAMNLHLGCVPGDVLGMVPFVSFLRLLLLS